MATAAPYTDPYLHTYTMVPAAGPGVCAVCRSGPGPGYAVCFSCQEVMRQVSHPVTNVVPISLYTLNSQLWHVLRHYKDGSGRTADLLATQVAAILARFTARHLRCVAAVLGGDPAVVTSVPSTRPQPRPGRHPLETAITRVGRLAPLYRPLLAPGPVYVDHNLADDEAFTVPRRLSGERVLLVRRHVHDRRAPAECRLRAPPERRIGRRCRGCRPGHRPGVERELPPHLGSGARNPVHLRPVLPVPRLTARSRRTC